MRKRSWVKQSEGPRDKHIVRYFFTDKENPDPLKDPFIYQSKTTGCRHVRSWAFSRTIGTERIELTIKEFHNARKYLKNYVEVVGKQLSA
jgi:hypothetical protein